MKDYYVIWTYAANYSGLIKVRSENPEQAFKNACCLHEQSFFDKATVYVFDVPPVFVHKKERVI